MPDFSAVARRLEGRLTAAPLAAAALPEEGRDRADGRFLVEHQETFASIFNQGINTYYTRFDEALKSSYEDALAMRNDAFVFDLLRHRQYPVLNVEHHLRPDDPKDPQQAAACAEVLRLLDNCAPAEDLRLFNMEALFWGRAGAQLAWGRRWVNGRQRVVVTDQEPIHGDKLVWKFDGTPGVMIHTGSVGAIEARGGALFRSDRAWCLSLKDPFWRSRFTIHKHEPGDTDFLFEADKAGSKHGVGLRDRVYWVWWLRQEALSWCMDALKRIGANGNFIGYYPQGNVEARAAVIEALKDFQQFNVTAFPKTVGTGNDNWFEQIPASAVAYNVMLQVIEYFDSIIRRAVVGQDMTGQGQPLGLGSTQADVGADVLSGINAYDAKRLARTLTRDLIRPLVRENFGQLPFNIRLVFEPEQDELAKELDNYRKFVDMGASVDLADLASRMGVRLVAPGTPGASVRPDQPAEAIATDPKLAPERLASDRTPDRPDERPSIVVVLPVPAETAATLTVAGGVPAADLHVTLAYLGRDVPAEAIPSLRAQIAALAQGQRPLVGTLGGGGTFPPSASSDGRTPAWAAVDVPGLAEFRQRLAESLTEHAFPLDGTHGWTPHVTRAYLDPGEAPPEPIGPTPVRFDRLALWVGAERTEAPFDSDPEIPA